MECEGIGPERAEAIAEWFADEANATLVRELRALGLRFEADEEDRPVEGPLTGTQYVITGTLESMSREQAREALEALGAKVSDNVSKKTTGVIVGESPGSKAAKGSCRKVKPPTRTLAATSPPSQAGGWGSWLPAIQVKRAVRPSASSKPRSSGPRRSAAPES